MSSKTHTHGIRIETGLKRPFLVLFELHNCCLQSFVSIRPPPPPPMPSHPPMMSSARHISCLLSHTRLQFCLSALHAVTEMHAAAGLSCSHWTPSDYVIDTEWMGWRQLGSRWLSLSLWLAAVMSWLDAAKDIASVCWHAELHGENTSPFRNYFYMVKNGSNPPPIFSCLEEK